MSRMLCRNKRLAAILLGSFAVLVLMPVVAFVGSSRHRSHRDSRDRIRGRHGDLHHNERHHSHRDRQHRIEYALGWIFYG